MIASLALALVLLLPTPLTAPAQDCELDRLTATPGDEAAIAAFRSAADEYAALHRRLERALMIDHYAGWPEEGAMESEMLADVIRAARPQSRPGAIFNPAVSELIYFRIGRAWWLERYHTAGALAETPAGVPRVNDWWFGDDDATPWTAVVWELPGLPEELEYRFAGRHLVLVDWHAGLVVDVLENALPER
jgi:hypothetical protein